MLVVGNDYRESPLYRAERVDNYLGMPGLTGAQLLDAYQRHAEDMGVEFRHGRVLNIMPMDAGEVFKTSLKGMDFKTTNIEGIRIDYYSLKGIHVDMYQAIALASLLGIIVD